MTTTTLNKIAPVLLALSIAMPLQPASGQSRSDGSVYGGFGVGERRSIFTSQAMAMGVSGVALFSPAYLNVSNPGAFSDQVLTRFAAGLDFTGVRSTDESNQSSTSSGGNIGALQFGFPIMNRKLGFASSYGPYTNAGYRAAVFDALPAEGGEPATPYESNYEGNGGLQEFTLGVGYRPHAAISIGFSGSAVWGILEDAVRTEYGNVVEYVESSVQRVTTRLSGFTGTVGLVARAPSLLGESDVFTFGAALSLPLSMDGKRAQLVNQGLVLSDSVGAAIDADVSAPMRLLAGVSYAPGEKWLIVADGRYEPWSTFESNLVFRGYRPDDPTSFNDAYRLGLGVQYVPAGGDPFASKWARTALRFGLFTEQAYAAPEDGYELVTYGLAGGLSLPTAIPGTYLDISGQIGTRGESEGLLVKDLLYRISVTLNFGERWFIRRRLR